MSFPDAVKQEAWAGHTGSSTCHFPSRTSLAQGSGCPTTPTPAWLPHGQLPPLLSSQHHWLVSTPWGCPKHASASKPVWSPALGEVWCLPCGHQPASTCPTSYPGPPRLYPSLVPSIIELLQKRSLRSSSPSKVPAMLQVCWSPVLPQTGAAQWSPSSSLAVSIALCASTRWNFPFWQAGDVLWAGGHCQLWVKRTCLSWGGLAAGSTSTLSVAITGISMLLNHSVLNTYFPGERAQIRLEAAEVQEMGWNGLLGTA